MAERDNAKLLDQNRLALRRICYYDQGQLVNGSEQSIALLTRSAWIKHTAIHIGNSLKSVFTLLKSDARRLMSVNQSARAMHMACALLSAVCLEH